MLPEASSTFRRGDIHLPSPADSNENPHGPKEQKMLMTLKEPIVLQPKLYGLGPLNLKSGNHLAPEILLSRFLRAYLHSKYLFCWIGIQLLMSSVFNSWCCHLNVRFSLFSQHLDRNRLPLIYQ